ncbi:MAG: amidohydrolase family protein [Calditrichia bacterium]
MKPSAEMRIANAWICRITENSIAPVFGDLLIQNRRIVEIREKPFPDSIPSKSAEDEMTLDAGGRVLTLPLVNFHEHIYSRLAKGLPASGPQDNFIHILENLWWKLDMALDAEMIEASARMAALESIRSGVTYIFDHHASPAHTRGSLDVIAEVLRQYGLRGNLCFETSDRNGAEASSDALAENESFIRRHAKDKDFRGMLGLHALFTLEDATLRKAADTLKENKAGIHIHAAEDKSDVQVNSEKYGLSLARRLQNFDLLNSRSIVVHGVHLDAEDYRIIAESGAALAYNPDSNLNNAVGLPRYADVPADIPVLAGTDGMHANIARSLKQLFLLYRHQQNDFGAAFGWFQKIYFDQLRFANQYFPDFPGLRPGDRADFILWDYIPPTLFLAENFWGHYIYGILERPVHSVIQNGSFLMRDFVIPGTDPAKTGIEIFQQGRRLFNAIQKEK